MSSHDVFNEELLSAYLDGELSPEERQQVEHHLAICAEHRELLGELRALIEQLKQLPAFSLDKDLSAKVMERTRHLAEQRAGLEGPVDFSTELLSAYVDGELTGDELRLLEQRLETDDTSRQAIQQLHCLEQDLQALPRYRLDDTFTQQVLRRVEELPGAEEASIVQPVPPARSQQPAADANASLRGFVWAALAIAAALLLSLFFRGESDTAAPDVVQPEIAPQNLSDIAGIEDGLRDDEPLRAPFSGGSDAQQQDDAETEHPIAPESSGAWNLVVDLKKRAKQHLVLVYEVTVTSTGVENAAFANLLRRHNIRFRDTIAVPKEDQRQLLKQRYLDGVKLAPDKTKGMDEIRLYLVNCKGSQADSIYQDLVSRPRGIGGFALNLTTKEAGQGVLNRFCQASNIAERSSEAVELLGSFAMLSQTARNLGVFGKIEWIEPALLNPPESENGGKAPGQDAKVAVHKNASTGDFGCEILFVVRNLKPIDKADETDDSDE